MDAKAGGRNRIVVQSQNTSLQNMNQLQSDEIDDSIEEKPSRHQLDKVIKVNITYRTGQHGMSLDGMY